MSEVALEDTPKPVQDLFNRGFSAFERGNLDYAVDMLFRCVETEPRLLQARKFLRAAEIQRFRQAGGGMMGSVVSGAKGLPLYVKATAMLKMGKAEPVMLEAEKLLKMDPLNFKYIHLLAEASMACDLPEAGVMTLETAKEQHGGNVDFLKLLGKLYCETGRTKDALACFEKVCELRPRDPEALKALKDAMALDSMTKDKWQETAEKGGSFREMIRDADEAAMLERAGKAVKSDQDADALIRDAKEKIEKEPENINYYRSLARLYAQRKDFEQALKTVEDAKNISPGDPELDRAYSSIRMQEFDSRIKQAGESGDNETVSSLEQEKTEFYFNDVQERVNRYPNDLDLRYEWGVLLFDNDYIDEAIQQFQKSQKNPRRRTLSLYYLGMCFKHKKQYDMAKDQFSSALEQLTKMDDTKKGICYELGTVAELMGDSDTARENFKKI